MKKFLIGLSIGAVLMFFFWPKPLSETTEVVNIQEVEVIRYDTLILEVPKYIYSKDTILVPEPIRVEVIEEDTISVYKGEQEIETDLAVLYFAKVKGSINEISFGIVDGRPEVIKEIYKERTVTISEPPKGLYVTGIVDTRLSTHFGLAYMRDRRMLGIGYDPFNKTGQITFSYKLFK